MPCQALQRDGQIPADTAPQEQDRRISYPIIGERPKDLKGPIVEMAKALVKGRTDA
jgi:hypothetical protein